MNTATRGVHARFGRFEWDPPGFLKSAKPGMNLSIIDISEPTRTPEHDVSGLLQAEKTGMHLSLNHISQPTRTPVPSVSPLLPVNNKRTHNPL